MAWTLQLLNDSTTLNINDLTNYSARSFTAPVPQRRMATGGANLYRHGSDIQQRVFMNRVVTVVVRINGTSQDNLIANINAINSILERASEYTTSGIGSQVKLRRKWEGATNQQDFHILEGVLNIGDEFSSVHATNTIISTGTLTLLCEPFAYGAEESIENFVADAGFEVAGTALADWTESKTATGTTARDTTQAPKHGVGSLKLVMTNSGGSGQVIERNQTLADVDAGEVWSFSVWVHVTALSNSKAGMVLLYNDGSATTTTVYQTSTTSDWTQLKLENQTAPSGATQVILKLRLEATAGSATGTCFFDSAIVVLASTVPTAWASSHAIANHYDDAAQASTNYIDINDVTGDVPALLQVRVAEGQSHDEFWSGARHGARQYDDDIILEGEDGTQTAIAHAGASVAESVGGSVSNSAYSGGALRSGNLITNADATIAGDVNFLNTWTLSSPPKGTFRVLAAVAAKNGEGDSATTSIDASDFGWGLSYTYGSFSLLDNTNPDTASFVAQTAASLAANTTSNFEILDLGTLTIPPVSTPDNQTEANLLIKVFGQWRTSRAMRENQEWYWYLDFIMLMPVDFGSNYISKTDAADVVLLDSMSEVKGAYLLNTSNVVQTFPNNQLGRSSEAHPDGTRVYFLAQNGNYTAADTFTVSITYRPRFLHVMGA
jgi:hypothetical protein